MKQPTPLEYLQYVENIKQLVIQRELDALNLLCSQQVSTLGMMPHLHVELLKLILDITTIRKIEHKGVSDIISENLTRFACWYASHWQPTVNQFPELKDNWLNLSQKIDLYQFKAAEDFLVQFNLHKEEQKARRDAEALAKNEAEQRAKREAEDRTERERVARIDAEARAKREAEEKARRELERQKERDRLAKIEAKRLADIKAKQEAAARAKQLANALTQKLGIKVGDRIGTLAWNTYRHYELYFGVSGMGAVAHTINPRLFPEQIIYIVNHSTHLITHCTTNAHTYHKTNRI
mgnify:CR=1 FL=1